MFEFNHFNFNVQDLAVSKAFYEQALDLHEARRSQAADGRFILLFMADAAGSPFRLELTWLRDHPEAYDLGEQEFHLCMEVVDIQAAYERHKDMGCVCQEFGGNHYYFIEDPDGYWIEIVPKRTSGEE